MVDFLELTAQPLALAYAPPFVGQSEGQSLLVPCWIGEIAKWVEQDAGPKWPGIDAGSGRSLTLLGVGTRSGRV